MKTILISFFMLFAFQAHGAELFHDATVIKGEFTITWHDSNHTLTKLQSLAIAMGAVEEAYAKCARKGYALCSLQSSILDSWGKNGSGFKATGKAVVKPLEIDSVVVGSSYKATSKWTGGGIKRLSVSGVTKAALDEAMYDCKSDGNPFCVYGGSKILTYRKGEVAEVKVTVIGYTLY